ncbi:hypothetical protein AAY81_00835 [Denitrobacterium detoxificans]|uniref:Uncharacterized protein n=1 Tax=Denitrobacterium detoxificans TaxID=79604 RepID=A0A172RW38_9ACTN|nr:hypothetical protein [Denitrobacterium detoxificans]ANE21951.1 hypothetical protein AAY81_00835 [Denitrobacterium detoxificans]SEP04545.1 hypothetical protein SAMN02910314_02011 [Denitrobacterium detoxificans]
MSTNKLDLVMTPDGIKQRVITPDDEMPDSILYQGVEYVRPMEAVPRKYTNDSLLGSQHRWCCGLCGKFLSSVRPSEGTSCPRCKAKVVYAR